MSARKSKSYETEIAISRAAVGILSEMYRGSKVPQLEPRRGTVVHDCYHAKKLSTRHQRTWDAVYRIFLNAAGSSVPNSGYGEARGGSGEGAMMLRGSTNAAQQTLDHLRQFHLHTHEWQLLSELVRDQWQVGAHGERLLRLDWLGLSLSGYRDAAQARSAGVASIHRLLDSLAEYLGF